MTAISEEIPPGRWMGAVAEALRSAKAPYSLGEVFAEISLWAREAREESWRNSRNRESLAAEFAAARSGVGPRLRAWLDGLVPDLDIHGSREELIETMDGALYAWNEEFLLRSAFRDLCEAAAAPGTLAWHLAPMAEALVSMLGGRATRDHGTIRIVRGILEGTSHESEMEFWLGHRVSPEELTPADWLELAEQVVTAEADAKPVVVWLQYRRAWVPHRIEIGPVSFFPANWAIPQVQKRRHEFFPEQDELRMVIEFSRSFADYDESDLEPIVLARVDLGSRTLPGVPDDAHQTVESILSLVVGEGGASWDSAWSAVTVASGEIWGTEVSPGWMRQPPRDDKLGTRMSGEFLERWAKRLNPAMKVRPMPVYLVEALAALRDAQMTRHRDVTLRRMRPVSERVATALEDHVLELVATIAEMTSDELVKELRREVVRKYLDRRAIDMLLSPIDTRGGLEPFVAQRDLAARFTKASEHGGGELIDLEAAAEREIELLKFARDPVEEAGVRVVAAAMRDAERWAEMRARTEQETEVLVARHRRVRNAITHGNPLTEAALRSVRDFSHDLAVSAINVAIDVYLDDRPAQEGLRR